MSIHVSSGSGLSGLPLSLVSTETSVCCAELTISLLVYSSELSEDVCMWLVERGCLPAERLPLRTCGDSSPQGPNAWATTSDCVLHACERR